MDKLRKKIKNYLRFDLSKKELAAGCIIGLLYLLVTSFLFYNSIFAVFPMLFYLPVYLKQRESAIKRKKQEQINIQFKDGMLAISSALGAGYSVENAFREAVGELETLYGQDAVMVMEFKKIERKIALNENVEDALELMAENIKLEDAVYFSEVFRFAKRSGGNLVEIIAKTASNISDKIEVKEDIEVLISGKKMEQKVMNIMPYGIIAYLRLCAFEFISPMYGNLLGISVMTLCLIVYLFAGKLSAKITNIVV